MAKANPADLARWLGAAWARYMNEYLAELDEVTKGRASATCGQVRQVRRLLVVAVRTGQYHAVGADVHRQAESIIAHVRDQHSEFYALVESMEISPSPALLALRDQLEAVRRDAEAAYGNRPE